MVDSFEAAMDLDQADSSRTPRELETREHTDSRPPDEWYPQGMLPDPLPRDGMHFRWVRVEFSGRGDMLNMSKKEREGWIRCPSKDFPEMCLMSDIDSRFAENIQIGGLVLCYMPEAKYLGRKRYYDRLAQQQMMAVDGQLMGESDPVMPMDKPERHTRVTFGRGE